MAVHHKGTAIAIWVTCAILLVVVVCLAVYLRCYRRRKRELRKLHRQLCKTEGEEHNVVNNTNTSTEWDVNGEAGSAAANPVALSGAAHRSALPALYPGFRRRTTEELESLPSPTGSASFATPLIVYLRVRRDQDYMECCDILLTVDRLRDIAPTDRSGFQLLGNDSYYHEDFLLYTAPLEFRETGVYVIHAFAVHPSKQIVGAVHQFTYVVTRGASVPSGVAIEGYNSSTSRQDNIDIDIARRLVGRNQNMLQSSAVTDPRSHAFGGGGNEPTLVSPCSSRSAAAVPSASTPLPPVIIPSGGEVTTSTDIVITPNPLSTTPDQLRYSVDGSYPNLLYNGPFTLSLPPPSLLPSQRRTMVIKAVAIRASNRTPLNNAAMPASAVAALDGVSAVTCVVVQVRAAGFSYFDAQVPTPSVRLRASEATLYFDESKNPPHTQTVYTLVYVSDARHKVCYSRQEAQVYTGQPITIPENVSTVHAWTVDTGSAADTEAEKRVRSVPTIYDCTRAATERGKISRRRIEKNNLQLEQLLPPPVMCVTCGDVELMFDDPPANGRIAYTLNDTEPALCDVYPPACAVPLRDSHTKDRETRHRHNEEASPMEGDRSGAHTFIYQPGKLIHVTQLETKPVYVTARIFVPIFEGSDGALSGNDGGQGGSYAGSGRLLGYRFGGVFHRGFYFNNQE